MDRRIFVATLAGLLAAPLAAQSQQTGKVWRIGYLGGSDQATSLMGSLREGLRELGYIEGRNLILEIRWGGADPERLRTLAAELISLGVDVLVAGPDSSIRALKESTTTIPIVMVLPTDPVRSGFIASMARPGGNTTGLSADISAEIHAKRLELLKTAVPTVTHLTVLSNPTFPRAPYNMVIQNAARKLGIALQTVEVRQPAEFAPGFASLVRTRTDALYVVSDPLLFSRHSEIIELAARQRLPSMYDSRVWTEPGGLMSYGADCSSLTARAATYVDKILKGAKPGDLPVEQPTKFEFVINLRTAKALRLTIPQSLLQRADQVIE